MTISEKRDHLIQTFGGNIDFAIFHIEEIREELLKQYNKHYSEDTQLEIGYWCNSDECKFWTEVLFELTNNVPDESVSERWNKSFAVK